MYKAISLGAAIIAAAAGWVFGLAKLWEVVTKVVEYLTQTG